VALRTTARRILAPEAEAHDLEMLIDRLVQQRAPTLLAQPGVDSLTAAASTESRR
jgi:hypothetical protein